ncbi:hypothetical protein BS17DRAFT_68482 [Gyrodon lividus]|nr:hypothetical protein BS17DRAFT_68482 [Gyrodon lividus]
MMKHKEMYFCIILTITIVPYAHKRTKCRPLLSKTLLVVPHRVLMIPALTSLMTLSRMTGFFMWSCSAPGLPCACCKICCMTGSLMIVCIMPLVSFIITPDASKILTAISGSLIARSRVCSSVSPARWEKSSC